MSEQLFRVGDAVDSIWGEGKVTNIDLLDEVMSVRVNDGASADRYMKLQFDGRVSIWTKHPAVWHKETGTPPKVGERPKWIPTKPTWCWVWDEDNDEPEPRLIARYLSGRYSCYEDVSYRCYMHAEPCEESVIPKWWPKEWRCV